LYRPRSIVRLILIGFAVVLTPLIAAVVTALVQVDRLAQDSRMAVLEAETATQQSRSLVEQLTDMQRALGQYQVFGDAKLYRTYLERRADFRNAIQHLLALRLTKTGSDELHSLESREQALFDQFASTPGKARSADKTLTKEWTALANGARAVLAESSKLIEQQANFTTSTANQLQRTLLLQAAAVIPVSLLLAALFVVLITRPMRQMGQAIRLLGARELSSPIEVHGPRDVEDLGKQLDWLRRRIQELEHQKTTFLRHISHELKTPLTTLREGSELLAESLAGSSPEEAEISRIMQSNSLHLQRLIEDLLQFGKTQELITDLRIAESVDLEALIRATVATQSVASSAKGICVEQDLEPVSVRGDENKLRILIDNLLANAIKYTPGGGRVTIGLRAHGSWAVIDVRDTGPGIDAAEREKIFEPFQQGLAEYEASVKGTGLGLAIAKEYAEAHDGYIKVVDAEHGAHFRVVVPLEGPQKAADA
jgi:two-component system sensor histidine kinase GlrK